MRPLRTKMFPEEALQNDSHYGSRQGAQRALFGLQSSARGRRRLGRTAGRIATRHDARSPTLQSVTEQSRFAAEYR